MEREASRLLGCLRFGGCITRFARERVRPVGRAASVAKLSRSRSGERVTRARRTVAGTPWLTCHARTAAFEAVLREMLPDCDAGDLAGSVAAEWNGRPLRMLAGVNRRRTASGGTAMRMEGAEPPADA